MRLAPLLHAAWISAVATAPVLVGCGGDTQYRNSDRPPTPITVTAYIGQDKVSISPSTIGGGPVRVLATNQTGRSQELTLETSDDPGAGPGIRQQTGPINPGDTASIRADVEEGTYEVHVANDTIGPATLDVGGTRETSQQELLLP
jgi:hypothetical protein